MENIHKVLLYASLTDTQRHTYPDDNPIKIEHKEDGSRIIHFPDIKLEIQPAPMYTLEYAGWVVDGEVRDWYEVPISLTGAKFSDGLFYEAWNYKIDKRRFYRFDKTLRVTSLRNGELITPDHLCNFLGGRYEWPINSDHHGLFRK
jgi:hypothetical protein